MYNLLRETLPLRGCAKTDEELIRAVFSDPESTVLECELAKRLEKAVTWIQRDEEELQQYHNKLSASLRKTTQVLSAC